MLYNDKHKQAIMTATKETFNSLKILFFVVVACLFYITMFNFFSSPLLFMVISFSCLLWIGNYFAELNPDDDGD